MNLYCCYTPAHEILLRDYFIPSIPEGFHLVAHLIEASGPGDFLSPEFLQCIRRKMDLILESLKQDSGKILIWSDIDIVFLNTSSQELSALLEQSGKDILFQQEGPNVREVNTGFIVMRAVPSVAAFFEQIRDFMLKQPDKNEQWVANHLLQGDGNLPAWGVLPIDYYARTHGWPPAKTIKIYHANYTVGKDGIGQKIRQFKELKAMRRWGWPAVLFYAAPRVLAKMKRKCFPSSR